MGVQDRVAIVTGAGQGIGEGIARALAEAGAKVVVNDVAADKAEKVAADIGGLAVVADISDPHGATELVERATDAYGQVDILVNNSPPSSTPAGR